MKKQTINHLIQTLPLILASTLHISAFASLGDLPASESGTRFLPAATSRALHTQLLFGADSIDYTTTDTTADITAYDNHHRELPSSLGTELKFKDHLRIQSGQNPVGFQGRLLARSQRDARTGGLYDVAGRYQLQMFGTQSEPTINVNGLSAGYAPATETSGAALQLYTRNNWQVSSAYFNTQSSDSWLSPLSQKQADAWDVAASRNWFKNVLTTRFEFARSSYEEDRVGSQSSANRTDTAFDTQFHLTSNEQLELPVIGGWRAGVSHQSVGGDFHNQGDRYLPVGLTHTRAYFETSVRDITIKLGWQLEDQSSDNLLSLAARRTKRSDLSLTYKPNINGTSLLAQLLGSPSVTTNISQADQRQPDYHAYGIQSPLLSDIDQLGLTLKFDQDDWYWGLSYRTLNRDNQLRQIQLANATFDFSATDPVADWANDATTLELGFDPSSHLSLKVNLQWQQQYEDGPDNEYRQRQYEIAARYQLIPKVCSLSMRYNYGRSFSDMSSLSAIETNNATHLGHARLSWHTLTGSNSRPAMDLYLQSNYGKFNNKNVITVDERWSASLGFKLYWQEQNQL